MKTLVLLIAAIAIILISCDDQSREICKYKEKINQKFDQSSSIIKETYSREQEERIFLESINSSKKITNLIELYSESNNKRKNIIATRILDLIKNESYKDNKDSINSYLRREFLIERKAFQEEYNKEYSSEQMQYHIDRQEVPFVTGYDSLVRETFALVLIYPSTYSLKEIEEDIIFSKGYPLTSVYFYNSIKNSNSISELINLYKEADFWVFREKITRKCLSIIKTGSFRKIIEDFSEIEEIVKNEEVSFLKERKIYQKQLNALFESWKLEGRDSERIRRLLEEFRENDSRISKLEHSLYMNMESFIFHLGSRIERVTSENISENEWFLEEYELKGILKERLTDKFNYKLIELKRDLEKSCSN